MQIADIKHDEKPKKGGPGDALMMIVRPSGDDGLQKYSAGKTIGRHRLGRHDGGTFLTELVRFREARLPTKIGPTGVEIEIQN